jgi:hypothetical protein
VVNSTLPKRRISRYPAKKWAADLLGTSMGEKGAQNKKCRWAKDGAAAASRVIKGPKFAAT